VHGAPVEAGAPGLGRRLLGQTRLVLGAVAGLGSAVLLGARVQAGGIGFGEVRFLPEDFQAGPGADDEGDDQAEEHGHAGAHGDGPHVGAHEAAHEGHGQDRGDHREGSQDRGVAHLVHRINDDSGEGTLGPGQVHVTVDVLHHHNGVVHQDADGEDQAEERDPVEGVAPQVADEQGQGQGHGHRDAHHHGAAPAHGDEDQGDHAEGGDEQVLDELVALVPGGLAVVAGDLHLQVPGDQAAPQGLHLGLHRLRQRRGVGAHALGEGHGDGGFKGGNRSGGTARPLEVLASRACRKGLCVPPAFGPRQSLVLAPHPGTIEHDGRLRLGAVADAGHIAQVDGAAVLHRHHEALELGGLHHEARGLHHRAAVAVHQRSRRKLGLGGLEGGLQFGHGHPQGPQALRIRLDADHALGAAHHPHLGGVGHGLQLPGQGFAQDPQAARGLVGAVKGQGEEGDIIDGEQLHDGLHRAAGQHLGVGHQLLVDLHQALFLVLVHLEAHGEQGHVGPGDGIEVLHPRDAPQPLLQGRGDLAFDLLGAGAGHGDIDIHHGHHDLGFFLPGREGHGQ